VTNIFCQSRNSFWEGEAPAEGLLRNTDLSVGEILGRLGKRVSPARRREPPACRMSLDENAAQASTRSAMCHETGANRTHCPMTEKLCITGQRRYRFEERALACEKSLGRASDPVARGAALSVVWFPVELSWIPVKYACGSGEGRYFL